MIPPGSSSTNSPFRPGYGKQPLVFGGHQEAIDELRAVFQDYDFGENQSVLISGLRGAGKTAMLGILQDDARSAGWITIRDDASAGLMERVLESTIPSLINELDRATKTRLKSFGIWHFSAEFEYESRQREVKPLLRNDLIALSRATDNRGVLILIDEVSSGRTRLRELSRFALEVSHALTEGANIMVVLAGVKVGLDELLKQPHTTFLRRSRDLDFRRLSPDETRRVLRETTQQGGREISPEAEDKLLSISQGYPYLVQLAGDYAWRNNVEAPVIELADADAAHQRAVKAIERRVISRIYLDLSEKDQNFLKAMAPDEGKTRIASIVARMGVSDQYVQVYKQRLIDSGYVQSSGHGYVEFSLPYLRDYVRSTMDDWEFEEPQLADGWAKFPPPTP